MLRKRDAMLRLATPRSSSGLRRERKKEKKEKKRKEKPLRTQRYLEKASHSYPFPESCE